MYACTHACTYVHTHARTYVCMYVCRYSESSVIRTSIIRILDYPDHKINLHVTRGLCNYRTNAHTQYIQSVHFQSHTCFPCLKMAELLKNVNVCMSTCMCICTMLYLIVFHLSELFTYPNKMFVAFDQWGSDNREFTVCMYVRTYVRMFVCLYTTQVHILYSTGCKC